MAFVLINPVYRGFLEAHGLANARRLATLAGTVICGHPDRHVQRVTVGTGRGAILAYLKREHRVPLRQRCANALAGFGFRSRSVREARLLDALRAAGVGCPEWIAAVEDDRGRALLLLRSLGEALDLRAFLRIQLKATPAWRRSFARHLGAALAHMHDAGFDHPDLYSKHVLVDPHEVSIHFLDWQRSRQHDYLPWPRRWRDLAALDATLADSLASERERLICLFAYLKAAVAGPVPRRFRSRAARAIRAGSRRLLRKPQVRELRENLLPIGAQQLLWLDGEALCATPELLARLRQRLPAWLCCPGRAHPRNRATRRLVPLDTSLVLLVRRRRTDFLRWLWSSLRRRPRTSPELRQAGLLFRLQRHGVVGPRLLAFGQRHPAPWRTDSFLLIESPPDAVALATWLAARAATPVWAAQRKQRWQLIRQVGRVLRSLHAARCYRSPRRPCWPLVVQMTRGTPTVAVASVTNTVSFRKASRRSALCDLLALRQSLPEGVGTRTDLLRCLLAYLDVPRLPVASRALARRLLNQRRRTAAPAPPLTTRLLQMSFAFLAPLGRTATGTPSVGRAAR